MQEPIIYRHSNEDQINPSKIKKNRFEIAIDEIIKNEVEDILACENHKSKAMQTPAIRRAHLEHEFYDSVAFTEFGQHIAEAIQVLWRDGIEYLEEDSYIKVIDSLHTIRQQLDNLDLNELNDSSLQEAIRLPVDCGRSILKIVIDKYALGQISECLSLLIFLTTVNPEEPDYWFRLGLVAQKRKNYPLALSALETTSELTPDFIGAHIYAANCYAEIRMSEQAQTELAKAKELLKTTEDDVEWQQQIKNVETILQAWPAF